VLTTRAIDAFLLCELACSAALGLAALDLFVHSRVALRTGVNTWGYRGPATFHKTSNERRIAMVGGSAAFGVGVDSKESLPSQIELATQRAGHLETSVVNLAEVGAGAGSYIQTLEDYAYLQPDLVVVYDGYASAESGVRRGRHASAVFRRFGYAPILADWLRGNVASMQRPVPIDASLNDNVPGDEAGLACNRTWSAYCEAMIETVAWGLVHTKGVIVVTPPYLSRRHEAQQESIASALRQQFGHDPRFVYVNLGPSVRLADKSQSLDGVHPTAGATRDLARRLSGAIDAFGTVPTR
jgi:hypothetical protein